MLHFRQTSVWQTIIQMTVQVYAFTKAFPDEERFALTSQMRRAAISIGSNFAEGFGRKHTNDFAHFMTMARGSVYELTAQVELAKAVGYIHDTTECQELLERIAYEFNCILKAKNLE